MGAIGWWKRLDHPRGAYHAVVFERDCGATADFSARISILPTAKQLRNQAGNIFGADAHNHLDIPLDSHGAMNLPAIWKSDQEVEITYPAKANPFLRTPAYQGVRISYLPQQVDVRKFVD